MGSSSILPGWIGVRAEEELGSRLGLPVHVDNDANLGALAELHWGAAEGRRNAAYLKVSTGIGAGLIITTAGSSTAAPAWRARSATRSSKRKALSPLRQALLSETLAGAAALVELLHGTHGPDLTTQQLLRAAAEGDSAARRVLADAGRHIGTALATLCDLLNPELIVVGGELSRGGGRCSWTRCASRFTSRDPRHRPLWRRDRSGRARAQGRAGALALVLASPDHAVGP